VLLLKGGEGLLRRGSLMLAEHQLRRELKENDHRFDLWLKLGEVLLQRGRHDEAWDALSEAARLKPDLIEAYLLRVMLCWNENWHRAGRDSRRRAVQLARRAVEESRKKVKRSGHDRNSRRELAAALKYLAEARFRTDRPALAESRILEALKQLPGDPELNRRLEKYARAAALERDSHQPKGSPDDRAPAD
jgi:tetratricopeptide (TPR) repeat protein